MSLDDSSARPVSLDDLFCCSVILNCLADEIHSGSSSFNVPEIQETVAAFTAVNDTLRKSTPGLQACQVACQVFVIRYCLPSVPFTIDLSDTVIQSQRFEDPLLSKSPESASAAKTIIFLCLLGVMGLVGFDTYQCGSFQGE